MRKGDKYAKNGENMGEREGRVRYVNDGESNLKSKSHMF